MSDQIQQAAAMGNGVEISLVDMLQIPTAMTLEAPFQVKISAKMKSAVMRIGIVGLLLPIPEAFLGVLPRHLNFWQTEMLSISMLSVIFGMTWLLLRERI